MIAQGHWSDVFCKRDTEIALLQEAYAATVQSGGTPRAVMFLADSGLGKTRLVQEFYSHLSMTVDGVGASGYWPDRLTRTGNNLEINPELGDVHRDLPMRFLWWGIRLADPGQHNSARTGSRLHADINELQPHLEPLYLQRRAKDRGKRTRATVRDFAINAFLAFVPYVGNIKETTQVGLELLAIAREKRTDKTQIFSAEELRRKKHMDLVDALIGDLADLFESGIAVGDRVPLVLVIDDAQWGAQDTALLEFVERLYPLAHTNRWPLLLLMTHWDSSWADAAGQPQSFRARMEALLRASDPDWQPHRLGKVPDLAPTLAAAIPGLTAAQARMLLDKADGNPRLLDEIIRWLLPQRAFFEGDPAISPLRPLALHKLEGRHFRLAELVEERLLERPEHVRLALGISALQDMRFASALTVRVCEALGIERGREGIEQGVDPGRFADVVQGEVFEFLQRVYRDVARDCLDGVIEEGVVNAALDQVLRDLLDESGPMDTLAPAERMIVLETAIERLRGSTDPVDLWRTEQALRRLAAMHAQSRDFEAAEQLGCEAVECSRRIAADVNSATSARNLIWVLDDYAGYLTARWKYPEAVQARSEAVQILRGLDGDSPDPEIRNWLAYMLSTLAGQEVSIERFADARQHLSESIDLFRSSSGRYEVRASLGQALMNMGRLYLAQRHFADAEAAFRESLEVFRAHVHYPDRPRALADCLHDLAASLLHQERYAEACERYRESLAAYRELEREQGTLQSRQNLAYGLVDLAKAMHYQDHEHPTRDAEEASVREQEQHLREGLEILRGIHLEQGSDDALRNLVMALTELGNFLKHQDRLEEERACRVECLGLLRELYRGNPTPWTMRDLVVGLNSMAETMGRMGQPEEAAGHYHESLALCRELATQDTPTSKRDLAAVLASLGDLALAGRDIGLACERYREVLDLRRRLAAGEDTPWARLDLASALTDMAGAVGRGGDPDAAEAFYRESLDLCRQVAGEHPGWHSLSQLLGAAQDLGEWLEARGDADAARPYFRESMLARRQRSRLDSNDA